MNSIVATLTASLILNAFASAQDSQPPAPQWWNNWRGPQHDGIAPSGEPPRQWSEKQNVRWKTALPGEAFSSPIIWKDHIYLTTAIPTDKGGDAAPAIYDFVVIAIKRDSGKVSWRKTVKSTAPHERGNSSASQAANSPITDGERIYAHFGSRGLYCLDMSGKVIWSKTFGRMKTVAGFGEGSSPALHGDTLIVTWDHEGDSTITAIDKKNGKERWKKSRGERTTWATPLVIEVDGKHQVIVPGDEQTIAYALDTGDSIWSCEGLTVHPIPTPLYENGILYLMSGSKGGAVQALKISGARGKIEDTKHLLWSRNRGAPYTPTGLVYGDYLYFLRMNNAVLSCLDAATGKVHYKGLRLPQLGTTYSSIVGANGYIYVTSRRGSTKVIKAGKTYEEAAHNSLDDAIDATFAFAGDAIYIRGRRHLYCIAETTK